MSDIKRLFKHGAVYAIGNAIQSAVAFLLIPVYTRYLSTAHYGYLEILNTFSSILVMVLSFGFASAILKTYFRDAKDDDERKQLVGTAFMFILPVALLATIIMFFFANDIGSFLLQNPEMGWLLKISLVSTFFVIFMNLGLAVLRAQERSRKYVIVFLLRFAVAMGLNLYFVIGLKLDVQGVLWANLISYAIVLLSLLPDIIKSSTFRFSKPLFKKLWLFGIPIIPASIAMWIMDISDRYMLEFFRDPGEVGIYSLGYKFGFLISIAIVAPFQLAWPTVYFSIAKQENAKQVYAKVLTYFCVVGLTCALAISLLAPEILSWFAGPDFFDAYKIVPFVAFAYVLYGIHFILVPGLHIREKTKLYPLMVGLPAIANILMNIWAIPRYGMYGAAVTTVLSFLLVVILTQVVTRRYYVVKYENWKIFTVFACAIALFAVGYYATFSSMWWNAALDIALVFAFIGVLFNTKVVSKNEIRSLLVTIGLKKN